jgi:nitrite reductase/ring-hydroxylating ferredoxin subunit
MSDRYDRLNRQIDALLADRAPRPYVAEDAEERATLAMAARLRLLRPGAATPRPRFAARMLRLLANSINPRPALPRRRLLLGSGGGALAGLAAGIALALGLKRRAPPSARAPGWALVGRLQDVPQSGALAFTTPAFGGYVMRDGDRLTALSAICNHLGCRVQWQPESKQFICPCDGAEFDQAGNYLTTYYGGPTVALDPLTPLAVRLEGDMVYVKPA